LPTMMLCLLLLLLLCCVDIAVCGGRDGFSIYNKVELVTITLSLLAASIPEELNLSDKKRVMQRRNAHNNRTRRPINSIFKEQGPCYVRRAYRMHSRSFWTLLGFLRPHMKPQPKKNHKRGAKNGFMSQATRLSVALRHFAGGRTNDIALVHGISHTSVHESVWQVVDAVNMCNSLSINYPEDHNQQRQIAAGFKRRSRAGFDVCAGAIDCMLVWIDKPTMRECEKAKVGPRKFFCGRKHKHGVNLQAVCDNEGRFLDIAIGHPASTSEHLCFKTSSLYKKLEGGMLAAGLVLFGDNAYVNNTCMATPFRAVQSGDKDDCNFYHTQVKLQVQLQWPVLYVLTFILFFLQ